MVILQLNIEAFGPLAQRTIDLRSGMNVITVGNETAREAIAAFIPAMLFGLSGEDEAYARFFPGFDKPVYGGKLKVLHQGAIHEVFRNFLQDGTLSVTKYADGSAVQDPEKWLRDALSGMTRTDYEKSGYVTVEGLAADYAAYGASASRHDAGGSDRKALEDSLSRAEARRESLGRRLERSEPEQEETLHRELLKTKEQAGEAEKELALKKAQLAEVLVQQEALPDPEEEDPQIRETLRRRMLEAKQDLQEVLEEKSGKSFRKNIWGTVLSVTGILMLIGVLFNCASRKIAIGHPLWNTSLLCIIGASVLLLAGIALTVRYALLLRTEKDSEEIAEARELCEKAERAYQAYLNDPSAFTGHTEEDPERNRIHALQREVTSKERALHRLKEQVIALSQAENTAALKKETRARIERDLQETVREIEEIRARLDKKAPEEDTERSERINRYLQKCAGNAYTVSVQDGAVRIYGNDGQEVFLQDLPGDSVLFVLLAIRAADEDEKDPGKALPMVLLDVLTHLTAGGRTAAAGLLRSLGRQSVALSGDIQSRGA